MTDYKYDEDKLLKEIEEYVNATYSQHYSQNKFQATEFILDSGHGEGFCIGNILKYAQRYGKKGTSEDWRKDLMKVIHYAMIAIHNHDQKFQQGEKVLDLSDTMIIPASEMGSSGPMLKTGFGYHVTADNAIKVEDPLISEVANVLSGMAKAEKLAAEHKAANILATKKPKNKVKVDSNETFEDCGHVYTLTKEVGTNWSSDDLFENKETK